MRRRGREGWAVPVHGREHDAAVAAHLQAVHEGVADLLAVVLAAFHLPAVSLEAVRLVASFLVTLLGLVASVAASGGQVAGPVPTTTAVVARSRRS